MNKTVEEEAIKPTIAYKIDKDTVKILNKRV